ncbi:MAG: phosphatidyl-myo-inositol dimannoside synthase [Pseudonocardiales bacterium]|jgi:glycosyltransferase involved in cell wall biosynthesis|nr:phosphatidyl-myo-inositol dimannoside synthase [Pseudonocardiales bacterium]
MRILVVNNFYPPRVGGSAHLADALARGYARAGHDVLVVTAAYQGAPAEEELEPRLRVVRLPSASVPETRLSVSFDLAFTLRPSLRRRLRDLLDAFAPDVIHQHGQFFDLTWATAMYARRRGIPALLSVHTRLENPKAHYHGIFRWLDAMVVAPILRRYKPRIVVMDVQMDDYIKRRYRGGYAGLDYIPVGVDPSRLAGGNGEVVRTRHGLGDVPLIVTLGHVIPLRDRVWLVEALPAVLAELPDTRLVVVGHVYYDLFLQRARELGVEHAVLAIGAVAKSDVPDYLAAADVECHDLQGYGMGTATLESMAAGVPVVVAVRPDNFPGIDLISGEHCVLVPLGDIDAIAGSITKLLRDPADRARIGESGRALVQRHFAMDVVLDQHLAVLRSLTGATQG